MAPTAYLVLEMCYPSGRADARLPKELTHYHERIEDEFLSLADGRRVRRGVSSADSMMRGGREWWTEAVALSATDAAELEPVAARVVRMVRRLGIRPSHRFTLRRRSADGSGAWTEWVRRVYASRDTTWQQKRARTRLTSYRASGPSFPDRLGYLAGWAGRCMGVGGHDVYGLFDNPNDLATFLANLAPTDQAGLVEIYRRIVRRKDNEWFLGWLRSVAATGGEQPEWTIQAHWLMMLLDRLRDAGLFERKNRRSRNPKLVFWDDYLEGKPE